MKGSRNNGAGARERSVEGPHGHLSGAIEDALLLRGSRDFETDRGVPGVPGPGGKPPQRPQPGEDRRGTGGAAAAAGAAQRRLRGDAGAGDEHGRLRAAAGVLHGALAAGGTPAAGAAVRRPAGGVCGHGATHDAAAGHAGPGGRRGRVVNYRHVLPSLRRKPMALLNWVHRDGLFPATPTAAPLTRCARVWTTARPAAGWWTCSPWPTTTAAKRSCGRDRPGPRCRELPDPEILRKRFPPKPDGIPDVGTALPPVEDYDDLGAPALAAGGLS